MRPHRTRAAGRAQEPVATEPRSRFAPAGACAAAVLALSILFYGCSPQAVRPAPGPPPAPQLLDFEATAYSIEGHTSSGEHSHEGVVAADPTVLPLGSRIRVSDAGPYSREYEVADTGRKVRGRKIDIYLADDAEAKRFGRKNVKVEILDRGGKREPEYASSAMGER